MTERYGIIIANLGSPAAPTPKALRKYLAQFLTDRRVIELHPLLWRPILHGIILRTRPARSAQAYQKIWGRDDNGAFSPEAPLVEITRAQADKLQAALPDDVYVEPAMRYGQPSIELALAKLEDKGCKKIGVLPLYPQYAGATVATVYDELSRIIRKRADLPAIRFLRDYHDNPAYIEAVTQSMRQHLRGLDWQPDHILVSFHGLPVSNVEKGDPYEKECRRTYGLLCTELADIKIEKQITFQSRFGPKEWLQPYTLATLQALAAQGKKKVLIITPGFSADSLETLEELSIQARQAFIEAGGEVLSLVPCLNDQNIHIDALATITKQHLLSGWQTSADTDNKINVIFQASSQLTSGFM
ncbi:MAG: ferrochelatase [Robiginitomaculum sp.]|nr:ferrochelatase [Robiginitomaculum sp.]